MSKYYKERGELSWGSLGWQLEEKAKHKAGDYMDDKSKDTKDNSIPPDALVVVAILILNLIHLIL